MAAPVTLQTLDDELREQIDFSRASSQAARFNALRRAYERTIRAVRIVKKNLFTEEAYVTIPAKTSRWLLTDPNFTHQRIKRIAKIIALGFNPGAVQQPDVGFGEGPFGAGGFGGKGGFTPSSDTVLIFRYAPLQSQEFIMSELLPPSSQSTEYFDFLLTDGIPTLALAPPLNRAVSVLITTRYEPEPLTGPKSEIEPVLETYTDVILHFAAEKLLRAVGDADADRWGADALQLRREMIEDLCHVAESNTVGVGSDLPDDDC